MSEVYPYAVLGLDTELVSDEEVRNAYLERVRVHPPETDPDQFQIIHAAYEAIQTEQKRLLRRYDQPVPDWQDLPHLLPKTEPVRLLPFGAIVRTLREERIADLFREGSV